MRNLLLTVLAVSLVTATDGEAAEAPTAAGQVIITPAPAAAAPKPVSYHVPFYDVNFPLRESDSDISNWMLGGMSVVTNSGISVLGETNGHRGSMWNHIPMSADSFEIELDVDVRGPPEARSADGFAVWYVDEADIGAFLRQPSADIWTLFGYRPSFKGFGAFFAASDRLNNPTSSVSGAVNNGTVVYDVNTSVPTGDGIYFVYRNEVATRGVLRCHIMFTQDLVRGFVRYNTEKEWRPAFTVKTNGQLPASGFIGVTASNRRVPKQQADPNATATGDRILLSRFRVSSSDYNWLSNSQIAGQSLLAQALEDSSDSGAQMRLLSESMMRHVLPKQDHMLNEMSKLYQSHRLMSERIDILFSYLSNNEKLQQALDRLDNLKNVVFRSSRDHLQQMEMLRDKFGSDDHVELLKQQSANLESTVKQHTQLATYLTVGLGVMFAGFGFLIYKRMRDMEKKHIL